MKNKTVKVFYDLETTGLQYHKHSIHQISGIIDVDGVELETFNFKVRPHERAAIDQTALRVCGVTEEEILQYPIMQFVKGQFTEMLGEYIDPYNRKDKAYLIGYNNRAFDDAFLRMFFELCKDSYFAAWFWADAPDVMCLASQHFMNTRQNMKSFKLKDVARALGVDVDETKLHDAAYDVRLTYEMYKVLTGANLLD